jgi:hypothetical protein
MADPRGLLKLTAGGKEYRLHFGMSVLADLQTQHGQDVLQRLDTGNGAAPDLNIVIDLFLLALQRHHADEASRYLVDDLLAENDGALGRMMQAAFPDVQDSPGNGKRPKRAA